MKNLFKALFRLLGKSVKTAGKAFLIFWEAGNYWVRLLTVVAVTWPIAMVTVAILNFKPMTVVPLLTLALIFIALTIFLVAPVGFIALARITRARPVLLYLVFAVVVEILVGIYLSIVPVSTDPELVPLLTIIVLAIAGLKIVGKWRWVIAPLVFFAVAISLIFFLGGRHKVMKVVQKAEAAVSQNGPSPLPPAALSPALQAPAPQPQPISGATTSGEFPQCPDAQDYLLAPTAPSIRFTLHEDCSSGAIETVDDGHKLFVQNLVDGHNLLVRFGNDPVWEDFNAMKPSGRRGLVGDRFVLHLRGPEGDEATAWVSE